MNQPSLRPKAPIERLLEPVAELLRHKSNSGILLFISIVVAMVWANSPWHESYHHLWEYTFSVTLAEHGVSKTIHHWINDFLMAIFFFVVGLEIKREIMGGELSSWRKALLPITAAVGGMVVPAALFLLFNAGTNAASGWGVPMATDIAFTLGLLSLMGQRVPVSLKIFLTALAIVDDLGAVLVIAFFYTSDISFLNLALGLGFLGVLIGGNLLGVRTPLFYAVIGVVGLWVAFFYSGVHATIAGVLLAATIPARTRVDEDYFISRMQRLLKRFRYADRDDASVFVTDKQLHLIEQMKKLGAAAESPLQKIEHALDPFVSFFVMPLFALANAGLELHGGVAENLFNAVSLGVMLGLVMGKVVGIFGFSWLTTRLELAALPEGISWWHVLGAGFLGGIGFTMSLFISELAFTDEEIILHAKAAILVGSTLAGLLGFLTLRYLAPHPAGTTSSAESDVSKRRKEVTQKVSE